MELIDGELPQAVLNIGASRHSLTGRAIMKAYMSSGVFICLGQAILIATATFYIALVYPFIAAAFYFVQKFYLRTSRQLRFMDLEAKSPL
jgi:hypothetical protein